MASFLERKLEQSWYGDSSWTFILLPLTWLFQLLSICRKKLIASQASALTPVPVVVIGNISVGGTGKTPLIIAIANECRRRGLKPGIISRGYGSKAPHYPFAVNANSAVEEAGDEPLLIAQSTACPIVISADRRRALAYLLTQNHCDLVLSDDGLQHYKLPRNLEIAVVDGNRGIGNGFCLPTGPLRESSSRLQTVDCVVVNGPLKKPRAIPKGFYSMTLKTRLWCRVIDDSEGELEVLSHYDKVHAVTGIGNPQRFFRSLQESNVDLIEHRFEDHYQFQLTDITFDDELPVVMTAKDAVKCRKLLLDSQLNLEQQRAFWYLPVESQLPDTFYQFLFDAIKIGAHGVANKKGVEVDQQIKKEILE